MTRRKEIGGAWSWLRYWSGYVLFVAVVGYGIHSAPAELWHIKPLWVAPAALAVLLMQIAQVAQFVVFLRAHRLSPDWAWSWSFCARKALLNSVMPARSGTLLLMGALQNRHPVKWHDYLKFTLIAGMVSLAVSAMALAWLMVSTLHFLMLVLMLAVLLRLSMHLPYAYVRNLPRLLLIAVLLYAGMLCGFWSVLNGLGHSISFRDASYFATALNALAQVALTPGNMGVRELVLGLVAPYISLPIATGIITGGVFFVLRLLVIGLLLLMLMPLERAAAVRRPQHHRSKP